MIWPLIVPVEPDATEIARTVLPASVSDVRAATLKLPPEIVNVCAPNVEALSVTAILLTKPSVAIVCVGTFVTIGDGVVLPSKINMSVVVAAAALGRTGDQLVGSCQSVPPSVGVHV